MGLLLLTQLSHRYTLTEGDFHHLKNARLTHLHLPPPALKIVTIHECESSENSLAMTPRLPPPKPGLAIFQVSPHCPRGRWDMGARHPAAPQGGIAGPRVGVEGIAGSRQRSSWGAGAHPYADPLSLLCFAVPHGGPAPAGAPQPCCGPQLCPARGHLQLHGGHQLHRGQPVCLLRLRGGTLGECWDWAGEGAPSLHSPKGPVLLPPCSPRSHPSPPAPCQGSGRDVGIQLETDSAPPPRPCPGGLLCICCSPALRSGQRS